MLFGNGFNKHLLLIGLANGLINNRFGRPMELIANLITRNLCHGFHPFYKDSESAGNVQEFLQLHGQVEVRFR